jgi:hypothetical protein
VQEPALVRYGIDGWRDIVDAPTSPNSLGVHVLKIEAERLGRASTVDFTFRYVRGERWAGQDYHVQIGPR